MTDIMSVHAEVWHISYWELTIRIIITVVLGGAIGIERELGEHAAGFRTHILVCLGSGLIMMLSSYGFSSFIHETNVRLDPARLAAQVISGIGFLGAGTILRTGMTVSGLTTAASLWVVAAIGLAVGAGFYYGAILTAFTAFFCLFMLNKWEKKLSRFTKPSQTRRLVLLIQNVAQNMSGILQLLKEHGLIVCDVASEPFHSGRVLGYEWDVDGGSDGLTKDYYLVQLVLKTKAGHIELLLVELLSLPYIKAFKQFAVENPDHERECLIEWFNKEKCPDGVAGKETNRDCH